MNNKKEEYKISFYDQFKCTADKCSLTCCSGWDISVDDTTYEKWNESSRYCSSCMSNDGSRIINKNTEDDCPFLDKDKLCLIVKKNGDEYLSETCRMFPRIINRYDDRKEMSLSCACPEVVEIISTMPKISMESIDEVKSLENSDIRKILINIVSDGKFTLEYSLILCYSMMNELLGADNEKDRSDIIRRYNDKSYLKELVDYYKSLDVDIYDSLDELNSLFIDITENYRHVRLLKKMLEDVCTLAENIDTDEVTEDYHNFKKLYEEYDRLNRKCIISKIYNLFMDDDYDEITVNMEMIILEYVLGRYALFLKYYADKCRFVLEEDVKESITVFSRIISSNSEAVREFILDGFESEILDIGYLCFISLM